MKNLYIRISDKNKDVEKCLEKVLKKLYISNLNHIITTDISTTYILKTAVSKPEIELYLNDLLSKKSIKYLTYTTHESNTLQILNFENYYRKTYAVPKIKYPNYLKIIVPINIQKQFKIYLDNNEFNFLNPTSKMNKYYIPIEEVKKLESWSVWEDILKTWGIKKNEDIFKFDLA